VGIIIKPGLLLGWYNGWVTVTGLAGLSLPILWGHADIYIYIYSICSQEAIRLGDCGGDQSLLSDTFIEVKQRGPRLIVSRVTAREDWVL